MNKKKRKKKRATADMERLFLSSLEVEDKAAFDDAFLDLVRVGLRVRVHGSVLRVRVRLIQG